MKLAIGLVAAMAVVGCAAPAASTAPASAAIVAAAPTATPAPSIEPTPYIEPDPTVELTPEATIAALAPLGTFATVGDWSIRIVKVNWNARAALKKANQFNDPAPKGTTPVMAYVEGKYTGTGREQLNSTFSLRSVGVGGTEYTDFTDPTCGVKPDPSLTLGKTVRNGATVKGWGACWVVDDADLPSLTAFWAEMFGDTLTGFALR